MRASASQERNAMCSYMPQVVITVGFDTLNNVTNLYTGYDAEAALSRRR